MTETIPSAIVEALVDGILAADADGKIHTVNASVLQMFGLPAREWLIGQSLNLLVQFTKPAVQLAFNDGEIFEGECIQFMRLDGTRFEAGYRSVPLVVAGQVAGCMCTIFASASRRRALNSPWLKGQGAMSREILENEKYLEAILNELPNPVYVVDPRDGAYIFRNRAVEKIMGITLHAGTYTGKQVHHVQILEAGSERRLPPAEWPSARAARGERLEDVEFILRTPAGDHHMNFTAKRVPEMFGRPMSILVIAQDITMIKKLTQQIASERDNLGRVFETTPTPSAVWAGPDMVYDRVNAGYQALYPGRVLMGRPVRQAMPEASFQPFVQILEQVYQSGQPVFLNEQFLSAPAEGWYNMVFLPLKDNTGRPYGVYQNLVDVTRLVHSRRQVEEAERANATKSNFLANMSHEIRTPLAAIIGYTDLLKEKDNAPAESEHFLNTISKNSRALTRIIDDILDLAKVESGKLEIEEVEFSFFDLMSEVVDIFRERTKAKGITLKTSILGDMPERVRADPTRLRQILINIIGNAVKFTEHGGIHIRVRCQLEDQAKRSFEISVEDTGVGLTPQQQSRLFQPFVQADNTTSRKFGGTGLGLVLARRLANAMGGDIRVESKGLGQGCTFTILFLTRPARPPPSKSAAPEASPRPEVQLSGLNVLVADDSPDNQFLVSRLLLNQGCHVEIANNGIEAFEKAVGGNFDIVLMDIQMPSVDGYEATRALRDTGFRAPILALTAHAMAEDRARSRAAGCNGHVTKPINHLELLTTIMRHVRMDHGPGRLGHL